MWSRLKRFLSGPPPPEDPFRQSVSFDDAGFTRHCELARAIGVQQHWAWADVHEFGFSFSQAIYPDPWHGDYMESAWYLWVRCEDDDMMRVFLDHELLDVDALPPALLRNLPGLDLSVLRAGLATARRGDRHFEGAGEWAAWRRDSAAS
ncbi:hypothetical protein LMG1873_02581 [Achromobacter piechaudii]|uniref:Uncharacterized protein n=1 Tax=Achromobacter piechaudii TaxID=72556 RepID=A0ABN7EZ71_9BURK|nr:hypothetical protein [Achromobacter piechaudii]CAB3699701.1 hypothetical protein LMG1873_02581 [Achromobacter piechaudii]